MNFSTPIDDLTLAALKRNCRRTQEKVYRDYSRPAWTLAVRLSGNEANAWDAVQNGFVKAFEKIAQLKRADRFGPWLRRIVVNQVMDAGRRSMDSLPEHHEPIEVQPDHDGTLDLLRALDRLDPLDRAVIWLHDVEGLTHGEVAETLDQSVPWSKTRLSRARAKARQWLQAPLQPPAGQDADHQPIARSILHGQ